MHQNNETVITINHLVKRFKSFSAVKGISLTVNKGEVFAFVGPNGATSGEAIIDKHNLTEDPDAVRRVIGYVPQMISVDGSLTAYENLLLLAKLYDIPGNTRENRIEEVLSFLDLQSVKKAYVKTFSGGMIRKLEIGQAIMHHPHVLFLDEPTQGLDPVARRNVWKHLLELREQYGMTIFFSTHYMEEAEEVADRVAIMHSGNIAAIGTVDELIKKTHKKDATLEDAFIHFTGTTIQETGNMREIKRMRQTANRLG
jgi:ABC-2 type transport system ATP-binding protein